MPIRYDQNLPENLARGEGGAFGRVAAPEIVVGWPAAPRTDSDL